MAFYDKTVNFVVGCANGCENCKARQMNHRFKYVANWEQPEFFNKEKLLRTKKGYAIFMNSLSDYGLWKAWQIAQVESAMIYNPQHAYIFMTKTNQWFKKWDMFGLPKPESWYFGRRYTHGKIDPKGRYDFICVEPLQGKAKIINFSNLKQVIIGAENGKGKIMPNKKWVDCLVKQCDTHNVKVYMQDSLRELMGADFRQDNLIWREWLEKGWTKNES